MERLDTPMFVGTVDGEDMADFFENLELEEENILDTIPPPQPPPAPLPKTRISTSQKPVVPKKERKHLDWDTYHAASLASNKKIKADKRRAAAEVMRSYVMAGKANDLLEKISPMAKQCIIEELTKELDEKANAIKAKLTEEVRKKLVKYVPGTVKRAFNTANQAFSDYKGFTYVCGPFFYGLTIQLKPDIPNIFSKPTEMDALRTLPAHTRFTLDKLVDQYYEVKKKKIAREARLAIYLGPVVNLKDLINLGIDYYNAYVKVTDLA